MVAFRTQEQCPIPFACEIFTPELCDDPSNFQCSAIFVRNRAGIPVALPQALLRFEKLTVKGLVSTTPGRFPDVTIRLILYPSSGPTVSFDIFQFQSTFHNDPVTNRMGYFELEITDASPNTQVPGDALPFTPLPLGFRPNAGTLLAALPTTDISRVEFVLSAAGQPIDAYMAIRSGSSIQVRVSTLDQCGVVGGENACLGCDSVPNSGLVFDSCCVCGGDGSSCSTTTGT